MKVFTAGAVKTAIARIDVDPAGLPCTAELWLSRDGVTKHATSGQVNFTSTGAQEDISLSVTMPAGGYLYSVYLDIYIAGGLVGAYQGTDDIAIPTASNPEVVW